MTTTIDVDILSKFVRHEVSLIEAGLTAQNWRTNNNPSVWSTEGFKHLFAFAAQDSEGLEFRMQAITHERMQLIARCQCHDQFFRTADDSASRLKALRSSLFLEHFLAEVEKTAQQFAHNHQQALALLAAKTHHGQQAPVAKKSRTP